MTVDDGCTSCYDRHLQVVDCSDGSSSSDGGGSVVLLNLFVVFYIYLGTAIFVSRSNALKNTEDELKITN